MKLASVFFLALMGAGAVVWAVMHGGATAEARVERRKLRVCADPNNLPFSNQKEQGFENKIAELLARDLDADLEYTWWAQRRGHIRNTIRAGACDVLLGLPTGMDMLLVTAPYYRSTYVFVYRKDAPFRIDSLDAPELRTLRVGVQLVGDDYTNTPPAHALARRGIVQNVRGYSVVGDYAQPDPPARIIEAVANGEVDVAVAWGPMAGYFARKERVPLAVVPVSPQIDLPFLPLVFDISLAVRRGEDGFKNELEQILDKRQTEIRRILSEYGIPQLPMEGS